MGEISEMRVIVYSVLATFLLVYLIFFIIFIEENIWWIFPATVYFFFFIARDSYLKNKIFEDNIMIKDRRNIRVNSY